LISNLLRDYPQLAPYFEARIPKMQANIQRPVESASTSVTKQIRYISSLATPQISQALRIFKEDSFMQ
jgi:hypothetical protein